MISKDSV